MIIVPAGRGVWGHFAKQQKNWAVSDPVTGSPEVNQKLILFDFDCSWLGLLGYRQMYLQDTILRLC